MVCHKMSCLFIYVPGMDAFFDDFESNSPAAIHVIFHQYLQAVSSTDPTFTPATSSNPAKPPLGKTKHGLGQIGSPLNASGVMEKALRNEEGGGNHRGV